VVARVSKKWFSLADTYAVDRRQDDVLVLAAAVVTTSCPIRMREWGSRLTSC
jgi:uncharacterized protein YxjI